MLLFITVTSELKLLKIEMKIYFLLLYHHFLLTFAGKTDKQTRSIIGASIFSIVR